jgi:ActR/RegA family two-component response regulator
VEQPAHILIVDDSQHFPQHIAGLLEQKGYRTTVVPTGEEALKVFRSTEVNLVISELLLPAMSGLNLLKLIKESQPELDVIIVTGTASDVTVIKALRLGAFDYIVKPLDDEFILYRVVEHSLDRQALNRENRRLLNDLAEKNQALQEALTMMKTMNMSCALIASSLEIGEILRMLVESAVEQMKAQKGYLLLLDRTGKAFSMKVCVGINREFAHTFSLPYEQGISGLVAASNRPLRLENDIPITLTQRLIEEDATGDLFSSPGMLSVPLRIKDRVVGVVNVSGRTNGKTFTDADVEFLTTLANHAAIALDHAGEFYRLKSRKG